MINCPKCNELLGDNVRTCFRCKHQITDAEYHEIMRAQDRQLNENWNDMFEMYHRKNRRSLIVLVSALLLTIALCVCFLTLDIDNAILPFVVGGLWGGVIIYIVASGTGKCPVCDQWMGRSSLFMTHCPRCGAKIRR